MKTIFLIRHAKSSWIDSSLLDYDRPLNERGKNDSPVMAARLYETEKTVDLIVSSSAKRAFSTAKKFAKAFGIKKSEIVKKKKIYEASIAELLEVINRIDNSADRVMIFGHNTTLSTMVDYLSTYYIMMPTCAIVRIDFDVNSWSEVSKDTGRFIYMDYPKK